MGKSQLKVSTSICSTPVQVTASDWLPRTKQVPADSPEVTNSKCSLHFRDTVGKRGVSSQHHKGQGQQLSQCWLSWQGDTQMSPLMQPISLPQDTTLLSKGSAGDIAVLLPTQAGVCPFPGSH